MRIQDVLLALLLPGLVLLHLAVSPYTKVEESFNLQATHDILNYHTPVRDAGTRLRAAYDHFAFPGVVPRSFVGALVLAGVSQPVLALVGGHHGQRVVRAVLGLFNVAALLRYKHGVDAAFGRPTGTWFVWLLASQFHVNYYASRTLPNMFAFGLCTLAMREFLPLPTPSVNAGAELTVKRQRLGIYLFVLAGVIFRAELAILLAMQLLYLLIQRRISIRTIIPAGFYSAVVALAVSIPIDSYFWQRIVWPELSGFIYNAVQGKSVNWGTSPFHSYFTSYIPKLLLNPLITFLFIPLAIFYPSTRRSAMDLLVPSLAFVAVYSLQPHKEARFILYVVPPLTACAARSASYVFTRRLRTLVNKILSILLVASVAVSLAMSFVFLGVSSFNYPGGEALFRLHELVTRDRPSTNNVSVHMDVLACMTGVSRFQQDFPSPPLSHSLSQLLYHFLPESNSSSHPTTRKTASPSAILYAYDKTETADVLLDPEFWTQFDYLLTEHPEATIGKWELVDTVFGFGGMEILRPGQSSRSMSRSMAEDAKIRGGSESKAYGNDNGRRIVELENKDREGNNSEGKVTSATVSRETIPEVENLDVYGMLRERIRRFVTRGWWVRPRIEPKIRILKRMN